MVSPPKELFRRRPRDETFGAEMRMISICVKLATPDRDRRKRAILPRHSPIVKARNGMSRPACRRSAPERISPGHGAGRRPGLVGRRRVLACRLLLPTRAFAQDTP